MEQKDCVINQESGRSRKSLDQNRGTIKQKEKEYLPPLPHRKAGEVEAMEEEGEGIPSHNLQHL